MGLRYRKQIKLLPGVKLNISKSGISTSVGKPGATVNFSGRGTRATVGIPGTGLSYSRKVSSRSKPAKLKKSEKRDLERRMRAETGISHREYKEFKRLVKKHKTRLLAMSDEEATAFIKASYKRRQRRITWALVVILVVMLVYGAVKYGPA